MRSTQAHSKFGRALLRGNGQPRTSMVSLCLLAHQHHGGDILHSTRMYPMLAVAPSSNGHSSLSHPCTSANLRRVASDWCFGSLGLYIDVGAAGAEARFTVPHEPTDAVWWLCANAKNGSIVDLLSFTPAPKDRGNALPPRSTSPPPLAAGIPWRVDQRDGKTPRGRR